MIFVRIIDDNGLFVGDAFVEQLTDKTVVTPCPGGFYLPRWDGEKWVESKTPEEIAEINASAANTPTLEERTAALEAAMLEIVLGG